MKTERREVIETLFLRTMSQGGGTWNSKLESPTEGYGVAVSKAFEAIVSTNDRIGFTSYVDKYLDIIEVLSEKELYIGTWLNEKKIYIDLTVVIKEEKDALAHAVKAQQLAIYDFAKKEVISL